MKPYRKNNRGIINDYSLAILKTIFICLAISVVLIGIFALVSRHSAMSDSQSTTQVSSSTQVQSSTAGSTDSSNEISSGTSSTTGDSTAEDSSMDSTGNSASSSIKDYLESSDQSVLSKIQSSTSSESDTTDSSTSDSGTSDSASGTPGTLEPDGDTGSNGSDTTSDSISDSNSSSKSDAADSEDSSLTKEERILSSMTTEEKVAQLFIITPEQLTGVSTVIQAGDATKQALQQYPVGGLIYFSKNIRTEEQLKGMLANVQTYSEILPFLGVDEEGGTVARVANSKISVTTFDDMCSIGAIGSPSVARKVGKTIGDYLSDLGFNLDFAPVADVTSDPDNSAIGTRSFGSDPTLVGEMAVELAKGLQSYDVSACMKHFPGLSDSTADTHDGSVSVDKTLDELRETDLVPFAAGIEADVDFIMVGHISLPNVTGNDTPASLSSQIVTDLLRTEMGYEGIIITDALNMGAITDNYTSAEAAVAVINAGADMILMPDNFTEAYQGVLNAVNDGSISEDRLNESVLQILTRKYAE